MGNQISDNNKRIARNTMFLYIRMFISMAVSLYTSRVVLRTLGVDDYGLYNVVGGVIGMFSFINATMAAATSRFLTFEIGKGNQEKLNDTFSSAYWVHVIIATFIVLLCETVGLWFVLNKMVIPEGREIATHIVFQLSILSTILTITQVPYNSTLIAHEKMDVYAYVEMANVFLRLGILYVLVVFDFDKLILYGVLNLAVSTGVRMFYRLYSRHHFEECRVRFKWQPEIVKPMLRFSGWEFYGNMSVTARTQGVAMLLNVFFGPVANAASAIATHVQGAVMSFASNINMASKPQIIKYYAAGNIPAMGALINNICRVNFFILLLLIIPLVGEINYILSIWLGDYPAYTPVFCILTLLFGMFSNMSSVIVTGVHAYGKIIRPNLINGTIYMMVVPVSYVVFMLGAEPWVSYFVNIVAVIIGVFSNAYTLHKYIPEFSLKLFLTDVLLRCFVMLALGFCVVSVTKQLMHEGLLRLISSTVISIVSLGVIGWWILLRKSDREKIVVLIKSKFRKQ